MRLLVLGGTRFLGRHAASIAAARGHTVTVFHRGRTGAQPAGQVETILGDRHTDLERVMHRDWDAVIDTCAYHPRSVELAARALRDCAARYLLVSSVSVYRLDTPLITDNSDLLPLPDPAEASALELDAAPPPHLYGPLKALCEQAARAHFGEQKTLIVRPGLIAGPYDPTDRFTYWPMRAAQGGEILAPDQPAHSVQFIDARDLAAFMLLALETQRTGVFNVTGPHASVDFGALLTSAQAAAGIPSTLSWVDEDFLLANDVAPWTDLPLWIPRSDSTIAGIANVDVRNAITAGLRVRPLDETVRDTLAWAREARLFPQLGAGLKPAREQALLAARHARSPH